MGSDGRACACHQADRKLRLTFAISGKGKSKQQQGKRATGQTSNRANGQQGKRATGQTGKGQTTASSIC